MSKLLTLASGRRAKWIVARRLAAASSWASTAPNLPAKYTDARAERVDARSCRATRSRRRRWRPSRTLQGGETAAAVVVYRRDGGLTAADREVIAEDRRNFNADLPRATKPLSEPIPSEDGTRR